MRSGGIGLAVALAVSLLSGSSALASPPSADADPEPVRILIVGDSVTHGSAGDWTWRYRLWKHYASQGLAVDFVGPRDDIMDNISGAPGSQDYLDPAFDRDHAARWGMSFEVQDFPIGDLIRTYRPDVVVEMLGVNDLTWGGAAPEVVEGRLRSFVTEARGSDPEVDLVLSRAPQTWYPGVGDFNARVSAASVDLDTPESRVETAHPDNGFGHPADTWDPAHANAAGELKIAAAMADSLAALGVGTPYPRPLPRVALGPRKAPKLTAQTVGHEARLSWSGPPGATEELVWVRDVTLGQAWRELPYAVTGNAWTAQDLAYGHRYDFKLRPVKGYWPAEADVRSNVVSVVPRPPTTGQPRATGSPYGRVALSWKPVSGATSYRVLMRDVTTNGAWRAVATTQRGTSATVSGLLGRHAYRFAVRATQEFVESASSPSVEVRVPAPRSVHSVSASSPRTNQVRVTGARRLEATSYRAYLLPVKSCTANPPQRAFRLAKSGLRAPSATISTRSARVWVRLNAVRSGVAGDATRSSTACVRVR